MFLAFIDSPKDWLVILLIVVLLFGGAKIPELARSLGRAKAEFSKAVKETEAETARPPEPKTEDERVRRAAKEFGIPTEGRRLDEIRADLRARAGEAAPQN